MSTNGTPISGAAVDAVRGFNRDYTRSAGLITERLLDTPHSLTEARVIYELAEDAELGSGELRERVGLDAGYLSRVVSRLEAGGLIRKRRSERDGRRQLLSLTPEGGRHRQTLDRRSAERVQALLDAIPQDRVDDLVTAMGRIQTILEPADRSERVVLAPPGPGDLGWVVERHGHLVNREDGWGAGIERLIAKLVAEYAGRAPQEREAAWIAWLGGERVGSIFCFREDEETARLRLLLVEPHARGRRLGRLLVEECIRFATAARYRELVLWTMDVLTHARPIYEATGFELVDSEPHAMFGPEVVGQTWKLRL